MIGRLILREKAIRSMVWLPVGLGAGLVLVALASKPPGGLPFLPDGFRPQYFFYPALYHWVYLAAFAAYSGVTGRGSRLCLALPLTASSLWLSRLLAVLLGGIAIVGVQYGLLALAGLIQGHDLVDTTLRSLVLGLLSCYVLGVVLAQLPSPSLSEIPLRPGYLVYLGAVWVATLALVMLVSAHPYLALAPLALAGALLVHIHRSLPRALAIVPSDAVPHDSSRYSEEAEQVETGWEDSAAPYGRAARGGPGPDEVNQRGVLIRILYNPWLAALLFTWLAFVGLRNGGYGLGGLSNTAMILWALLALSGLLSYALPRLHMVDALPISRGKIFAYLVIPGLVVALGSYTVGTVRAKGLFTGQEVVTYGTKYYDHSYDVRVPLEYWEISANGSPAPVEGCCDEAHATWSTELVKGTDLVLFSPYHTPPGSPPEFVAQQLSRAIADVFGTEVPPAELVRKYFKRTPEGGTALKVETMNLLDDYPQLRARGWLLSLPVVYMCVGLPWFLYLIMAMGPLRSLTPGRSLLRGHLVITFIAAGSLILMIWASSNGVTKEYKVSAAIGILVRKAATAVPGGVALLWVLSVAGLVMAYLVARSAFQGYEFPTVRGPR